MITISEFQKAVRQIADGHPIYRSGGTGDDGTCDCIGLIMGAMYRCGHSPYPLHGSNYFARREMAAMKAVSSAADCFPGMIVYKARDADSSGYSLPDRYKPGGQYYNGDIRDYYHVGVVTGAAPFSITHCTSSGSVNGITTDNKLGNWCYGGLLSDIDYNETIETENYSMNRTAIVFAENGKPVNLRKQPNAEADILTRIPVGEGVTVTGIDGNWATVEWNGLAGYMMRSFLHLLEEDTSQNEGQADDITAMLTLVLEKLDTLQQSVNKLLENATDLEGCK